MATFIYSVRDKAGKVVKGQLEGESKDAVQARLSQMGYIILELEQQGALAQMGAIKLGGTKVQPKDVSIFARQFSTMINAGLSLTKCLTILGTQTESPSLREIISQLGRDVEAGQSLSDSLGKHPKVFPPIFVNMVRAGETGGVLDEVLQRIAEHLEAELALKAKVKSAMTYPIAMGCLVLVVMAAMMIFVVPTFEKMFNDMGGKLPLITQLLVDLSHFIAGIGGVFVALAGAGIIFGFRWWSSGPGKTVWDAAKLSMPVFGSLTRKIALAKFCRTFGTLVSAGVPILTALDIVADTSGNNVVAGAVKKARASVKEGETLSKPLGESKVFPAMVVQMIGVGEETGALDTMLEKVADFYDEEVSTATDGLTSLIEPLMMATLGIIVGGMIIALYLPMFQVITLVQ
jgi:type IV pilus assembly protein PilC